MKSYHELVALFEKANSVFLSKNRDLFVNKVSERTLCGALMLEFHDLMNSDENYSGYYADVEYNRNKGSIEKMKKTVKGIKNELIPINCDLIIHSRGNKVSEDNLIAFEMKKSHMPEKYRKKDKERLILLTSDSYDGVWKTNGKSLPKHVCGYILGVYYEINYRDQKY